MSRRTSIRLAAVALAAGLSCSQRTAAPAAQMSGTRSLVTVGDLLFVTSADRSELRVLDLVPAPTRSDQPSQPLEFVRAPNVLEPLSIPVVDRPSSLTRDVHYASPLGTPGETVAVGTGGEVEGPYVYAISEGSPEISVVGPISSKPEDSRRLVELRRLREAAPITAFTARGGASAGEASTLYFATYDGTRSEIRRRQLPPVDQIVAATEASLKSEAVVAALPNEPIVALLSVPSSDLLIVATRGDGGRSGTTFELNMATSTTRVYDFPAPVRLLATHGTALQAPDVLVDPNGTGDRPVLVTAGRYIFGVLDEAACRDRPRPTPHPAAVQPPCRGVMAVDTATGKIAHQFINGVDVGPMLPIAFGNSLPTSLMVVANGRVNQPSGGGSLVFPLLGMVTVATGEVVFFDGANLRAMDADTGAVATVPAIIFRHGDGTTPDSFPLGGIAIPTTEQVTAGQPPLLTAAEGAAVSELVNVTYKGALPGFALIGVSTADAHRIPLYLSAPVERLRVDDHVLLGSVDGACAADLTLGAFSGSELTTVQPIPAACLNRDIVYTVRAAPAATFDDKVHEMWVVVGGVTGYLGRARNDAEFIPDVTRYFARTASYDPANPAPQIRFTLGGGNSEFNQDDRFELTVAAGFVPYFITFDLSYDAAFAAGLSVPSSIAYREGTYDGVRRWRAFIAYPASKGLLEVNLPGVTPAAVNSQSFVSYR